MVKVASDFPNQSSQAKWPKKEEQGRYKIQSLWIELSPVLTTYERQTYSMLELFGDVGGLLEALKLLGGFVVMPIATFALKAKLLYLIFG